MRQLRAELAKLIALPSVWVATAIAVVGPAAFTFLTVHQIRDNLAAGRPGAFTSTTDLAFAEFQLTMLAAVVLGVAAAASEYTASNNSPGSGRQITTSLLTQPRRLHLLGAKVVALVVVALLTSAGSIGAAMCVAVGQQPTWGNALARFLGAVGYWCAVALMSFAIGLATRTTVVPITLLGVNLSVISVSFLLLNLTPLARYLPDLAGATLLLRDLAFKDPLPPLTGGLVMAAWTVGLLAVAGALFVRRDA